MNKKCIISIKGLQTYVSGEDDSDIELFTEGEFYKADGVYFCEYKESEITGLSGTDTTIEIGENYVSLERSGAVNSQMLFMEGRKTSSLYNMQFGELLIDIYTEKLDVNISDSGGEIKVDYIIDINNATTGKNKFEITIKEDNSDEWHYKTH